MLDDLTDTQRALAEYMSELSEQSWSARWLLDIEYELWRAVDSGPLRCGHLTLTVEHVRRLRELHEACGGWIFFDSEREETFAPAADWQEMYATHRARWQP